MKFKIPFSGRQHEYSDDEVSTVLHAMRNADPLTQGDFLHEFEKKICHYLGVENALNFRQPNPILSAENPHDQDFDSSLIWGPIFGRMVYFGFRFTIDKHKE